MRPERAAKARLIAVVRFAIISLAIGSGLFVVRLYGPPPVRRGLLQAIQLSGAVSAGALGVLLVVAGVVWTGKTNPADFVRNMQAWGQRDKHWPDLPYHFLIAPDGEIYEGRFLPPLADRTF